jgi:hypothetical protein
MKELLKRAFLSLMEAYRPGLETKLLPRVPVVLNLEVGDRQAI